LLMIQYVTVHPTVEQAAAMLDGMQDPAFLAECLPPYLSRGPPMRSEDLDFWTPVFIGQELTPPSIDVNADDVWVRQWTGSWSGVRGALEWGPAHMASAAV